MNPELLKMVDQISDIIIDRWGEKTLAQLRMEAAIEKTGIAFDAIRASGGQRILLVLCATTPESIAQIEFMFALSDEGERRDWLSFTVADLAHSGMRNGVAYEDVAGADGKRAAVAVCVARPDVMKLMEIAFHFPP